MDFESALVPSSNSRLGSDRRWVLVPLGNPGRAYEATRHNLGRWMLDRAARAEGWTPELLRSFRHGVLERLGPFLCLRPGTYMNHSGYVAAEALAAGLDLRRWIVLYDDKDLPLGRGRLRREGSAGGHNGLASVLEAIGTDRVARWRLGIGPSRRPLADWVLEPWTDEEQNRLKAMDLPFRRALLGLAEVDEDGWDRLTSRINDPAFWEVPAENGLEAPGGL